MNVLAEDKKIKLKEFQQYLNYICRIGNYNLYDFVRMDQTLLPFIWVSGTTYDHYGSKNVYFKTGATGLEERQVTAPNTLLTNAVSLVKPLIIFKDKGLRIFS